MTLLAALWLSLAAMLLSQETAWAAPDFFLISTEDDPETPQEPVKNLHGQDYHEQDPYGSDHQQPQTPGYKPSGYKPPVDGKWSAWLSGKCGTPGVTCKGRQKTRRRYCSKPRPAHGGQDCEGSAKQTVDCNTEDCPGEISQLNFLKCVCTLVSVIRNLLNDYERHV